MKDLKKLLLGAAATTAAAGVFFASDAAVAKADAYVTPVDADGVPTSISGKPAVNVDQPTQPATEAPDVQPVEEDNSSNLFKPGVDKDGVPTSVSGNEAVEQPEEVVEEDPYASPYEYEAETKEAAIEIGEAMLKRSELEGTALAEVNNHVDAVQTASGKWTPQFSYVEKEETPAEENEKPAEDTEKTLEDLFDFSGLAEEETPAEGTEKPAEETEKTLEDLFDFSGLVEEDPEFEFDPDQAYDNLADAFVAAETAIKNDPVNKGYDIQVGADGKYYVQLQVEANTELEDLFDFSKLEKEDKDEKAEATEKDGKKEDTKVVVANEKDQKADKEAKAEKANAQLPATGVVAGSVAGLGAALVAAGSAFAFRRRK
ncbi:DUF5633 domain-containing protein [Aerococcus sp. Group 1]|uniref:DUF5633 domain-containing protein n=1 Tax=Aerococcus urinae (strain CCUG 59500 / ACS-120-V-Col10a) TaxID=2976812 RepID=UPI000200E7A5|nr:DUF5633 domain-containing protein [Aerococcus sp. Group 1]AEA00380.1 LPXTG-motif cell wall anchor domain protein [Aerococcus sp. Group 1]MCY3030165.1 DUF5633 domain-containing protein [Aerococcus sp. Group 1]MCY3055315.1 DUF5633 domain-containing protein [Aerococcus sp. Group 1]MCY3057045.1 DUF5633 domain-containing protein [Aerococcus sp. Group 1]MCY3061038.1 DUF5633 domain-containing protein [Aerococcus sp. Group 1]